MVSGMEFPCHSAAITNPDSDDVGAMWLAATVRFFLLSTQKDGPT